MIIIAHRGNTHGPKPELENKPEYVLEAISKGFDVEVDVWHRSGELWLGHDKPMYKMGIEMLRKSNNIWCHAKTVEALDALLEEELNCFWHENDKYTLTSHGFIWAYPGQSLTRNSIAVCTDDYKPTTECAGYCSDYVGITQ